MRYFRTILIAACISPTLGNLIAPRRRIAPQSKPIKAWSSSQLKINPTARTRRGNALMLRLRGGGEVGKASFGTKAGLQACLTALNIGCWLVPLNMKSFTDNARALSLANSFSGGVFLALAFGHLLPHSIHELAQVANFEGSPETTACAVAALGYLLVFVVEKIVFNTDSLLEGGEGGAGDAAKGGSSGGAPAGKAVGAVLLLSALAVHSLVEAAALGVQSTAKSAYLLAASIGLHQPAESVALLVALVKAGLSKSHITALLSAFSMIGPIGLLCGVAAKDFAGSLAEPLLVALTAGTFFYVGATEVVAEEFESYEHAGKWSKFVSFSVGMGLISVVISMAERLEATAGLV
mmetsp:Transcript_20616/g.42264  ORF Transcript_20616/g.42264 Transcript_20616/m.42264 type:complete len:351 (-) Transcript_20616:165-1217(-)